MDQSQYHLVREMLALTKELQEPMTTILLLNLSNVFMTFAWYGHLKYGHGWSPGKAILGSWSIALLLESQIAPTSGRLLAMFVPFSN